jgi:hypothetical protein
MKDRCKIYCLWKKGLGFSILDLVSHSFCGAYVPCHDLREDFM